jgi:cell division protein ZapA (FtsZ GTPase activity inhibitor)
MKNVLRKLFSLIPVTVMAASVLTAAVTQVWWVVLMGLVAAIIIAAQSALSEEEEIPQSTAPVSRDLSKLGSRSRKRFQALLEKKRKILQALEGMEESPFLDSKSIAERVEDLIENYYQLLMKLQDISAFLDGKTVTKIHRSVKTLEHRIDQCNDQVTRENLKLALHNKTDELKRIHELQRYGERIDSQLVSVATALNSIYSAIVQIKYSPDTAGSNAQEVKDRISELLLDVDISEKVIREINHLSRGTRIE